MPDNPDELIVHISKRRKLPHWLYDGSVYFVTWRLHAVQRKLNASERDLVQLVLHHFDQVRYDLYCYVVMDDHVHVLCRPRNRELWKLVHTWKSFAANQLQRRYNRKGVIWQEEYFDRAIRNEREFYDTARYILHNPVKRWGIENYVWMGFRSPEVEDLVDGGHGGPPS